MSERSVRDFKREKRSRGILCPIVSSDVVQVFELQFIRDNKIILHSSGSATRLLVKVVQSLMS